MSPYLTNCTRVKETARTPNHVFDSDLSPADEDTLSASAALSSGTGRYDVELSPISESEMKSSSLKSKSADSLDFAEWDTLDSAALPFDDFEECDVLASESIVSVGYDEIDSALLDFDECVMLESATLESSLLPESALLDFAAYDMLESDLLDLVLDFPAFAAGWDMLESDLLDLEEERNNACDMEMMSSTALALDVVFPDLAG